MGNWNRRYQPRKKCRYSQYEEPSSSSSIFYNTPSHSSGVDDKKVPSWEMDYCNSLKVPWFKILASKRYIYCYPTVLDWDDSAGEEAFRNAKQRYWAMINGFPCDSTLPDPDMFIHEIDWSPYLDPDLMADLEHLYVNLNGVDVVDHLETVNEDVESPQARDASIRSTDNNPWEKDHAQSSPCFKDALQEWKQYRDPWQQNQSQLGDSSKENAWRSSGNNSWDQGLWRRDDGQPIGNAGSERQEGWGHGGNKDWSHGNANGHEYRDFGNCRHSWENSHSTGLQERGRWGKRNGSENWRDSEYQANEPNCWNPKGLEMRGTHSFHRGGQKRESSLEHMPRCKYPWYQKS